MQINKFKRKCAVAIVMTMVGTVSFPVMAKMSYKDIDAGKGIGLGNEILVPYVDSNLDYVEELTDISKETGITRFNLGFIISDGKGNPIWIDQKGKEVDAEEIADEIKTLRKKNIDIMISFGGKDDEVLHREIEEVNDLAKAYAEVIKAYDVKAVDFYMDGKGLSKLTAAKRNIDALVKLQKEIKDLEIWLTLPADEDGLGEDALQVIEYAESNKLDFEGINLMTYTYNTKTRDSKTMADKTIGVIEEAYDDLGEVLKNYNKSELWKSLGVTPLIGNNGGNLEFTPKDAEEVGKYVVEKGMGYVGFYDVSRDNNKYDYAEGFATILLDKEAPTVPTELKPILVRSDQVVLTWKASTDNHKVKGYKVYREDEKGNKKTFEVTTTKFVDTDVKAQEEYEYEVTALDEQNNESKRSDEIVVKTPKAFKDEVKVDQIKDNDITETSVKLSWKAVEDADFYRIYRDGEIIAETKKTEFEDKNLEKGKTYTYLIEAIEDKEIIASSKSITVTTKGGAENPNKGEGTNTGNWKPGKNYKVGDIVTYKGKQYVCVQAHQALGDWYPNPDTTLALWNTVPTKVEDKDKDKDKNQDKDKDKNEDNNKDKDKDKPSLDANMTVWEAGVSYKVEDVVLYGGKYYSCIQAHTAVSNWTPDATPALWGLYELD